MRAKEILSYYLRDKEEISVLEVEIERLTKIVSMKNAKYGDEQGGVPLSIEEKYWKYMQEKQKIELMIEERKRCVAKVEKVLELISATHPHECNAMLLRHVHNKKVEYIEFQIGFSRNIVAKKIRFAEEKLERLMNI